MDLNDTPAQAAHRERVRAFLADHRDDAPSLEVEGDVSPQAVEVRRAWQRTLAEGGLAGVTWPVEYGGRGLGVVEQAIVEQEMQRADVVGVLDFIGLGMMGPTLMAHGSEDQKARHLGPMLHGDEVWCQLFSEPAAGSDLAGVQARARRQDDGSWRIGGQKVWTTNAQFASFGMLLARTDPDVPKHKGLTMFIVAMDAPGVTTRPLRQIAGDAHFNEVFFDDAVLPADAVVGPVDGGWRVALTVLMFERLTLSGGTEDFGIHLETIARELAAHPAVREDAELRRRLGELGTELLALRFGGYRTLTKLAQGQAPGPEAGLAKIGLVQAGTDAGELVVDVAGPGALQPGSRWYELVCLVPGLRSAGGTSEILRNTVGERALGLPPEPRLDKDVAFSQLGSAKLPEVTSTGGRHL